MDTITGRTGGHLRLLCVCMAAAAVLMAGCSHVSEETRAAFSEANDLFSQGSYTASLERYQAISDKYPEARDKVLFEMGIVHAHSGNMQRDFQKALECFQRLVRDYPESGYRKDAEMLIFQISNVIMKDETIAGQQALMADLRQEISGRGDEIRALQGRIGALGQEVRDRDREISLLQKEVFALQKGPVDRVLIEKSERRLSLVLKGRVLKTYRIALGGNPEGPKERQGDNKTPEGTYVIDSRNRNSGYHLSLHISYPNEQDKKRARELGVSPGGDIMIHGIKNGLSRVGDMHAGADWTKGCIAVTDEEIEEIERLAPNGTVVEIRP